MTVAVEVADGKITGEGNDSGEALVNVNVGEPVSVGDGVGWLTWFPTCKKIAPTQ